MKQELTNFTDAQVNLLEAASHRIDEAIARSERELPKTAEGVARQDGYEEGLAEAQRLVKDGINLIDFFATELNEKAP